MVGRKREVRWTQRAIQDKLRIMEFWYLKNQSVNYSLKLERLFNKCLELLSIHPEMGIIFSQKPPIHFKTVRGYRLYYTFDKATITLITIWDTRRNPDKLKI
jgi:plasmid stabilization system protein ParE